MWWRKRKRNSGPIDLSYVDLVGTGERKRLASCEAIKRAMYCAHVCDIAALTDCVYMAEAYAKGEVGELVLTSVHETASEINDRNRSDVCGPWTRAVEARRWTT